jgi:hypothetical protein
MRPPGSADSTFADLATPKDICVAATTDWGKISIEWLHESARIETLVGFLEAQVESSPVEAHTRPPA